MLGERKIRRTNKAVNSVEQGACNNERRPYECKYYNKCFCSSLVCKQHELVHASTGVKINLVCASFVIHVCALTNQQIANGMIMHKMG